MATAYVQSVANSRATLGTTITMTLNGVAVGDRLFSLTNSGGASATVSTPSDTGGNTWQSVQASATIGTVTCQMHEARNVTTGGNLTFTIGQSQSLFISGAVMETSGTDTGAPDLAPTDTTVATNNTAAGAQLTNALAGDILVTGAGDDGAGVAAWTISSGWTTPASAQITDGSTTVRSAMGYQAAVAAGTYTPTWTTDGTPNTVVADCAVKVAAVSGLPPGLGPVVHMQDWAQSQDVPVVTY